MQAFTLELMAKEAKVGNGGLPHHFPNKTGLPGCLCGRWTCSGRTCWPPSRKTWQ
ncbi:hypothetical protein [Acetobacter persici]|uniref:hypothetical protein n=1 Tax=Acetobacter persici TaxID=1076596 RepID=UPI0038D13CAF